MSILLIDTYSLFFRSFYALPPMSTKAGVPTNALYGFSTLMLKLIREHQATSGAFAVDAAKKTFRHDRFDGYKQGRAPAPDPLRQQLARLPELLSAFGFPTHRQPGFEADDVLATLAASLLEEEDVIVVSGDRDVFQLARPGLDILFLGRRGKPAARYDVAAVRDRYGVEPSQLPTVTALLGDTSDNLPKVPGIGDKTAARLVAAFGGIAAMLSRLDEVSPARARAGLEAHRDQALLVEELARLRTDVELDPPLIGPRAAGEELKALFNELEMKSLLKRL